MHLSHLTLTLPLIGISVVGAWRVECKDLELTSKPVWTISGAFTPDGSQLLLVDSLYSMILRYSNSGESSSIGKPVKSFVQDPLPATAKARGEDIILEIGDSLMQLERNFRAGYPYITSLGESAYLLSMVEGITLYRVLKGKGAGRCQPLKVPASLDLKTQREYPGTKGIERNPMPVGLFG
jgi:hypothetical protein